jgi:hypothetical protein
MTGRPRIPLETREAVLADVRADLLTSREIGERHGISYQTVDAYAKEARIRRRHGARIRYPLPVPGSIFGRWKVIGKQEARRGRERVVLCQCQCPARTEELIVIDRLYSDRIGGCILHARITHGLSHHELYPTWIGIMMRCFNPNSQDWPNYGGRGVTIHEDWRDVRSFVAWIEANLGPRPEPERRCASGNGWWSIDRINPFGNYEPGNLRWAEPAQQTDNQRQKYLQPRKVWECAFCGEIYSTATTLRTHRMSEHMPPCELCGMPSRSSTGVCSRPGACHAEYMRRYGHAAPASKR